MFDAFRTTPEQVRWCAQCRGRVGVDCDDAEHDHQWVSLRRRRRVRERLFTTSNGSRRNIVVDDLVEDGFGGAWERCARTDCDLQVVRPGKAQCSGESDNLGCPRDAQELIDRLYGECMRLARAGDVLADGVRTGRWDNALDSWDEARCGWTLPDSAAHADETERIVDGHQVRAHANGGPASCSTSDDAVVLHGDALRDLVRRLRAAEHTAPAMLRRSTDGRFDEWALLADIVDTWGEHGAHADVCRFMIDEIVSLRGKVQATEQPNEHGTCALEGR